ncbi:NAD(P)/FAD-dependent oxidoreductase [Maricaulis sp.]|uniref:NAD(P)/FAD-dependent oxidoreductase n=1 Tax=Maricaulis sp. TaxID=1486257 RepID=UPI00262C7AEB|nr:NAD(P)/FAD-dependent oxidoreductase [Maricaulis sp.]
MSSADVAIIGAGAAGMFCAIEAGRRGRKVVVIDHAKAPGEKIRISGGGRCNFTNIHAAPENFISANRHFVKSALKQYTQYDFIDWVDRHGIAWHEKTLGQLFCDNSAKDIIGALREDMAEAGVDLRLRETVEDYERTADGFALTLGSGERMEVQSLVVACGGKSIPKMGATGFGYEIAAHLGLAVTETRPALVPMTFDAAALEEFSALAGVAAEVRAFNAKASFDEAMLFTHRGLSGPAILQLSSYWREGEDIEIRLAPETNWLETLRERRKSQGGQSPETVISQVLPKRLGSFLAEKMEAKGKLAEWSEKRLNGLVHELEHWTLRPVGSEGYRTAEVTLGGVDTAGLNSKTMETKTIKGLYFIGEVVDVTGWLGGYNFQWAWSSGWCAGQHV